MLLLFPISKKLCNNAEKRLIRGNFRNIENSVKLPEISREYTLSTHYYLPGTLSMASTSIEFGWCVYRSVMSPFA